MNRPATLFLAALDALIAVAIGVGVMLVFLTVLWATQFGLAVDWLAFWRASADIWLLGNGVDLLLTVDPDTALRLGVEGAGLPFEVGIAPLGVAVLTLLLGARSGSRLTATPYPVTGAVAGVLTVAALGLLVSLGSRDAAALSSVAQSAVFPAAVYAVGLAIGSAWVRRRVASVETSADSPLGRLWSRTRDSIPGDTGRLIVLALRGGTMAAAGVVVVAAVAMALILVVGFSSIVALYESLQAGIVGGAGLTLAQLALLPNLVIWTAAWFVGPGFAIGAGSAVSPIGTHLGLVPALPVLGALPQGTPALGFAGLVVPVALGFAAAAVLRPAFLDALGGRAIGGAGRRALPIAVVAIGMGVVGASILALVALWSGGAAGPGRLAEVGPDAGAVWLWSFVEFTVPAALGLISGASRAGGPRPAATVDELRLSETAPVGDSAPDR